MKLSMIALAIFSAPAAALGSSAQVAAPPAALHLSLKFNKVPLGNFVRILSARFGATVAIGANARAPITGDFSGMDLRQALTAAGSQSGLVVVLLGKDPSAGYCLDTPKPAPPAAPAAVAGAPKSDASVKVGLDEAARRRLELLRAQQGLLEQSSDSETGN